MRAGNLRRRITIQTKSIDRNSVGEQTVAWVNDAKIWAEMWPLRGAEYFNAQQIQSGVTYKFRCRHRTLSDGGNINSNCRILYDTTSRVFNIASVINVAERNKTLEFLCTEEI